MYFYTLISIIGSNIMLNNESFVVIIYSLPIYQLFFYSILTVTIKNVNPPRKYFGFLLMTMTGFLLLSIAYFFGTFGTITAVYIALFLVLLSVISLFYLYMQVLLQQNIATKSTTNKLVVYMPTIGGLLLFILIVFTNYGTKEHFYLSYELYGTNQITVFSVVLRLFMGVVIAFHLFLTTMQLAKLLKVNNNDTLMWLNLSWVYIIIVSMILFIVVTSLKLFVLGTPEGLYAVLYNILILVCGGLTGYFGLKQNDQYALVSGISSMGILKKNTVKPEITRNTAKKPEKLLDDGESDKIISKIKLLMNEQKPFLNKRFCLDDLSRLLGVKRKDISYVVNHVLGNNFSGFVNEYRIREAIDIMKNDTSNLTIEAISDNVGFHSRSSFYSCFKKFTGKTPVEYLSMLKHGDHST